MSDETKNPKNPDTNPPVEQGAKKSLMQNEDTNPLKDQDTNPPKDQDTNPPAENEPKKSLKEKVLYFKCVARCTFNGRYWKVGDSMPYVGKKEDVPTHFELIK